MREETLTDRGTLLNAQKLSAIRPNNNIVKYSYSYLITAVSKTSLCMKE